MYKLHLGDCLEILPTLDAGSIDAIITDLPYGTTACKWDTVIPFVPMWKEVKRVLKHNGVFVTTASQPFTSALVMSNIDMFKYEWIWNKRSPVGFLNVKIKPMLVHENIVVFCEGTGNYNPQFRKTLTKLFGKRGNGSGDVYGKLKNDVNSGVGYPFSLISDYPKVNNLSGGGLHPTQKPVALYEYLIRTYTNEGDTVLDICMGSGTTIVAAIRTGRNAIGIEKDAEFGYMEIAEKRCKEAELQPVLFRSQLSNPTQKELL